MATKQRIGIYTGTFDPVHSGHISFALQAIDAGISEVHFLPERTPRHKAGVEHYGHRVGMLRRSIRPHKNISIVELADKQFTVRRTLPQLQQIFRGKQIVLLMGADVFVKLPAWPDAALLAKYSEFFVAIRNQDDLRVVLQTIQYLAIPSQSITIVDSLKPDVSSTQVRQAIRHNQPIAGLLSSVARYARREWLYANIP